MPEIGWRMEAARPGENTRAFTPTVAGSMSFDLGRDVPKTVTGLVVPPDQWRVVDVRVDRIRIYILIDGAEFPMGSFAFSELTRQKNAVLDSAGVAGDMITTALGDYCLLLIRNTGRAESVVQGFDPSDELQRILSNSGLPYSVAAAANLSNSGVTWSGDTTDLAKAKQLGELSGHRPLWMNNDSVIRSVAASVIDTEIIPLASLQPTDHTVAITEKFLTAPNRVIVTDNSSASFAISGQWDAPASAPHSAANRGYVLADTQDAQGLGSQAHAENVAATIGEQYTARTLSARIIPTNLLDGPQVISYDNANWLLQSWDVDLSPGSDMSITCEELVM